MYVLIHTILIYSETEVCRQDTDAPTITFLSLYLIYIQSYGINKMFRRTDSL